MKNRFNSSVLCNRNKEMDSLQDELQQKVDSLHSELELTILRRECKKYEAKTQELQERLNAYEEKEHAIADVLLNAQTQAKKVENQARERVRQMEARIYEDIRRKAEELKDLKMRMEYFMEEVSQMLHSLEYALTSSDSAVLPNPVLFANADFDSLYENNSLEEQKNIETHLEHPAKTIANTAHSIPSLKTLTLSPDIKVQPLRIITHQSEKD